MSRIRLMAISFALAATSAVAGAQHSGASGRAAGRQRASAPSAYVAHPAPVSQASGGAWTGKASKWGGSPVRAASYQRAAYPVQTYAYIPAVIVPTVVVVPEAVPVYADTAITAYGAGPTEMQVVTTHPRELTTMEVYRQHGRFAKPQAP